MPIRHWPKGIQQPVDTLSQVISTLLSIFFSSSLKFGLHIYIYFKKKKQQNHEKPSAVLLFFDILPLLARLELER
jgi:hypothetical protein